jgi:hypothetical protein
MRNLPVAHICHLDFRRCAFVKHDVFNLQAMVADALRFKIYQGDHDLLKQVPCIHLLCMSERRASISSYD